MPSTPPTGIPAWAYVLGITLIAIGTVCAAVLVFRGTRMSVNQQGYQDLSTKNAGLINQLEERFNTLNDRFEKAETKISKLTRFSEMARRYIYQQDAWIIRVYDPAIHTIAPPEMPAELRGE